MQDQSIPSKDWKLLVSNFESSEQTQVKFCDENNLKLSQFSYYLEKYRTQPKQKRRKLNQSKQSGFIPLSLSSESSGYQICLPNHVRLLIPRQFTTEAVNALIEILK